MEIITHPYLCIAKHQMELMATPWGKSTPIIDHWWISRRHKLVLTLTNEKKEPVLLLLSLPLTPNGV